MPKGNKKTAALSGSLLVQEGSDPAVGFVLRSLDEVKRKPTGKHSGAKRKRAGRKATRAGSKLASDGPALHEVSEEESPRSEQARHQADAEDALELGPEHVSHAPERGPGTGTVELAPGPLADNNTDAARDAGRTDFLAALREGDLSRAEDIFGHLTDLDPVRAKRVLYGPGGRNLALACKALGAEQLQFVSILILTRKLGPNGTSLNAHQLTDLVSYFLDIDEMTANRVLNQWRAEYIEVFGEQS